MEMLRKCRLSNNLSMQNIANLLNISKTYYWQIENNKRRLSYILAIKIADLFDKKPDDIFYEEMKNLYFNQHQKKGKIKE